MFTGIIESLAVLRERKKSHREMRLSFELAGKSRSFRLGESVAVDGVCLTVSGCRGKKFSADLIPETLRSTTLGGLAGGEPVNIERALRVGDPLGGHWVTGHVDGVGRIQKIGRGPAGLCLHVSAPPEILRLLIPKGSIAVDGISFTLQEIRKDAFVIGITPHTYRVTTLRWKKAGDRVNLENDVLAKWVHHPNGQKRVTSLKLRDLRKNGF